MTAIVRTVKRHATQRGYALVLSLVIMGFGTLVVGSMLTYVGAHVNTRAIARDNMNAYYAANAGAQLVIAKLVQADYTDPDSGELVPLAQRFDDGDGTMEYGEPVAPDYYEYYKPSDPDLFPYVSPPLSDNINDYEVRMTVEYVEWNGEPAWSMPEHVIHRITAYVFEPGAGASRFDEAIDKVIAVVRQTPYPLNPALTYHAEILSWQRQ